MIMKGKNKRNVILISTFHDESMGNVTTRKGVIQKPSVVLDNKNRGVNKNSQHIS
jgi:glutaredoxin